jgi:hypothetical protein
VSGKKVESVKSSVNINMPRPSPTLGDMFHDLHLTAHPSFRSVIPESLHLRVTH